MSHKFSHRERIEAAVRGEKTDCLAASIWRHFFHLESSAEKMARAMLHYQDKYDWDFMKINPRASYHTEDWGDRIEWSRDEFVNHNHIKFVVSHINDWDKIDFLPVTAPVLSDHLKAASLIKKETGADLPLFMTVFSPIGIARRLTGSREKLMEHLNESPKKVTEALERITVTFEKYTAEIRNAGADGLFFATLDLASGEAMTSGQYNKLCRPLDLRILKAAGDDSLNILHVCGSHNFLKELSDYPVDLINWDSCDPTNCSLESSFDFLGQKTVIGGLDHKGWLLNGSPDEVAIQINRIKERMIGKKFILGPGCTIDPRIPHENILAVRENL
jgi:uroporphyrinogen decarboxylase